MDVWGYVWDRGRHPGPSGQVGAAVLKVDVRQHGVPGSIGGAERQRLEQQGREPLSGLAERFLWMADGQETVQPALMATIKERLSVAMDRLLRDCVSLAGPAPELLIRLGQEPLEHFDERYPDRAEWMRATFEPGSVYAHVSVPPDRSVTTIRCPLALSVDELCFELADHLQEMMIKEVWGAWPACPLHDGQHPIWATLRHGDACWECLDEPGYSVLIGHLRAG